MKQFEIDTLRWAYEYAWNYSQHPETKVGAILLQNDLAIGLGANRAPKRIAAPATELSRGSRLEHAERGAILAAAKHGNATNGATLVAPWFACVDCARAIIGAGVRRVVGHQATRDRTPAKWRESIAIGDALLHEAGVELELYVGYLGGCKNVMNGEIWEP